MRKHLALVVLAGGLLVGVANAAEVFVRVAPPPPVRVGVVGVAPHPGYIWLPGYHEWHHNRYVWREGRWVRTPYARAVWVEPRWVPRNGGYAFVAGYWRH
jgi:WXXGXW repeat (2 copies)